MGGFTENVSEHMEIRLDTVRQAERNGAEKEGTWLLSSAPSIECEAATGAACYSGKG
ncbi:MAG: hypothetical protein J5898_00585 [Lachnospiraceae bacterium]|nr:hypothetical protein [Lachnospiraceae bacterium]MBP5221544.1 hypothetical protein [Lachnospiraceae bacterium]